MRNILTIFFLFAFPFYCFSQVDPRMALYNDYFTKNDFKNALMVAESLIASYPQSIEPHREKAKMLAAMNQREAFFKEMQLIRDFNRTDNIDIFFSVLSHSLVKKDLRDDLKRFFNVKNDTQVLLSWPKFPDEVVFDCSKIVNTSRPETTQQTFQTSSNQSANSEPQAISDWVDWKMAAEKKVKIICLESRLAELEFATIKDKLNRLEEASNLKATTFSFLDPERKKARTIIKTELEAFVAKWDN